MRRSANPYRYAIEWILNNDDTDFLDDGDDAAPSVSACLVADIYNRSVEEVVADMRKWRR